MISALQEHARKIPLPADASMVEMTSNFLEACHLIFEKGILSHMRISPKCQRVLENIKEGFSFFKDWFICHQNTGEKPVLNLLNVPHGTLAMKITQCISAFHVGLE